jgi:hypothetical protein
MVKNKVFEGTSEGQLAGMHGPHAYEVVNSSIRFTDTCMANAGEAAGNAGKSSPDDTVWESLLIDVHLHIHFKFRLHLFTLIFIHSSIIQT